MISDQPILGATSIASTEDEMDQIVSRFKLLLAEKEMKERTTISMRDVSRATGISIYTITGFANNSLREVPLDAAAKLCRYFGVALGELLTFEDVPEQADAA